MVGKKVEASTEIAIGEKKLARQRPKHASLRRRCLADMVKSAIKVVVRVRPTPDFAQGAIDLHQDKKVRVPKQRSRCRRFCIPLRPRAASDAGARCCSRSSCTCPRLRSVN